MLSLAEKQIIAHCCFYCYSSLFNGPYIQRLTLWAGQCIKRMNKMKIVCEVCKVEGYVQHIGPNYYRVRHYVGSVDGKPKFEYHKQSLEYVQRFLNQNQSSIDPIDLKTIDPKKLDSSSISNFVWTGGDLNPRPPECKSGVHTNWTTGPLQRFVQKSTGDSEFRAFGSLYSCCSRQTSNAVTPDFCSIHPCSFHLKRSPIA